MSDATKLREATTDHGRAYQLYVPWSLAFAIDWTPASPIHGHARLTGGEIQTHATEGKVVTFKETVVVGRKKQTLAARLSPDRGTLVELVRLAEAMRAEVAAEVEAETARKAAEHAGKLGADLAAFEATLPAGYVAIEKVDHNPGAADGWGMTDYRHGGIKLTQHDVHELDPRYHHPLGNAYDLRAYVPAGGLDALLERKRAAKAEKDGVKAAKLAAREADRAAKIALARETGKAVELERWTEECDGSVDECSTDIVYRMAQPDGTIATRRTHTH
jgi:hypothetical protein